MRISFFLLLFSFLSFAQEKEQVQWDENRPLSWKDFKAAPEESLDYQANSNTGISFSWNYSTKTGKPVLEYEVFTKFNPNASWVKDVEESEYLLQHEQLHFDISELHARKLRRALSQYTIGRNIRKDLQQLYGQIERERKEMQNLFDAETNHSINKEAELSWRKFVAEELKRLENYKN